MLANCNQAKNNAEPKQLLRKPKQRNAQFCHERNIDDYLSRLAMMKEKGSLVIGGKRIC
jgi:hypothetical protein